MEVDLLHGFAVDFGLGLGNASKGFQTFGFYKIRQIGTVDDLLDVGEMPMALIIFHIHKEIHRPQMLGKHNFGTQGKPLEQRGQLALQPFHIHAQVHQGAQGHVSADAGNQIQK